MYTYCVSYHISLYIYFGLQHRHVKRKSNSRFFSAQKSATEEVFRLPTPKPYLWIDVGFLQCIRCIMYIYIYIYVYVHVYMYNISTYIPSISWLPCKKWEVPLDAKPPWKHREPRLRSLEMTVGIPKRR